MAGVRFPAAHSASSMRQKVPAKRSRRMWSVCRLPNCSATVAGRSAPGWSSHSSANFRYVTNMSSAERRNGEWTVRSRRTPSMADSSRSISSRWAASPVLTTSPYEVVVGVASEIRSSAQ